MSGIPKLMCFLLFVQTLLSILSIAQVQCLSPLEEAATINREGMVAFAALYGMKLDIIHVVTDDKWRLQIHRVRSPEIFNAKFSTPVLIIHGVSLSSADCMINRRSESLAFILADSGRDVFLMNHRTSQFSNEKVSSSGTPFVARGRDIYETASQYAAQYDIPAALDMILKETGQEKIHLIGHSQGGANIFFFFASNHSYDDKIGHFAALSPTLIYGDDMGRFYQLALKSIAPIIERLPEFLFAKVVQWRSSGAFQSTGNQPVNTFCYFLPFVCEGLVSFFVQKGIVNSVVSSPYFDKTRAPVLSAIWPGGTTGMFLYEKSAEYHMTPKNWTKIDYRRIPWSGITNQQMYNSDEPPFFNFPDARINTSMVFVKNDIVTGLKSGREVIQWLKPAASLLLDDELFSHLDFIWSWKAPCLVYDFVLKQFDDFDDARGEGYVEYRRLVAQHKEGLEKPRCATQSSLK